MHGSGFMMVMMLALLLLASAVVILTVVLLLKKANPASLLTFDLASTYPMKKLDYQDRAILEKPIEVKLHDTVFVLPDISHYTRFMAGSHFSFSHAQEIIFSLINAMIEAATPKLNLSKLEGDAALFFVDADALTPTELGEAVLDIFTAFYSERTRLIESNICICKACKHIEDLDLKIFLHRGTASRFEFRGSIDHFGTDVIILHRLMKNSLSGHRYIMVTDESKKLVEFPYEFETLNVNETDESIGTMGAAVYELSDDMANILENRKPKLKPSSAGETYKKVLSSLATLRSLLFSRQR